MTTPRDIDNYGGKFQDAFPVEDPTTEKSAAYGNREAEDQAQMTRTTERALVRFALSTGGAGSITPTDGRSHYGVGSANLPTVAKTATGRYTVTYATSYTDALGEAEAVAFYSARGWVESLTTAGHVQCTVSGRVISVATFDMTGAASDLSGAAVCVAGF